MIPVGSTEALPVDVRIIAATNRDLEEEIRKGTFRSDLYYRLNVIQLRLPPLRDRMEDVELLGKHFLTRLAEREGHEKPREISDACLEVLRRYDWPGNVRELENALERAAVISSGPAIQIESLPERVREQPDLRLVDDAPPPNPSMEVIEQAYIRWVLEAEGGNKTRAAEVLGIDPSTLYRKLNRYGLAD